MFPAVAGRLADLGADLFVTSWTQHDREQPWGADPGGTEAVLAELGAGRGTRIEHLVADFLGRPYTFDAYAAWLAR